MISRSTTFLSLLVFSLLAGSSSCDLINPEEQIPSFICIDTISFDAENHGQNAHDIVDAWVFDNEQLVGVYELPATVPILNSGDVNIRIRPGVKLNGTAATRWRYQYLEDFVETVELFEDSVVCVSPQLVYKEAVATPILEDFESAAQVNITNSTVSQGNITIIQDENAFEGKSAKLTLPAGQIIFECESTLGPDLPGSGAPVTLEFAYKGDVDIVVSLLSETPIGPIQTQLFLATATDEWKFFYISLTEAVSSLLGSTSHKPVFGWVRNSSDPVDEVVYLDNIRLIHFE